MISKELQAGVKSEITMVRKRIESDQQTLAALELLAETENGASRRPVVAKRIKPRKSRPNGRWSFERRAATLSDINIASLRALSNNRDADCWGVAGQIREKNRGATAGLSKVKLAHRVSSGLSKMAKHGYVNGIRGHKPRVYQLTELGAKVLAVREVASQYAKR